MCSVFAPPNTMPPSLPFPMGRASSHALGSAGLVYHSLRALLGPLHAAVFGSSPIAPYPPPAVPNFGGLGRPWSRLSGSDQASSGFDRPHPARLKPREARGGKDEAPPSLDQASSGRD